MKNTATIREIKAFVRQACVEPVISSLTALGIGSISIISVDGVGGLSDPRSGKLSVKYPIRYSKIAKIELVCRADDVDEIVNCIRKSACTNTSGDGMIYVTDVDRIIKIRSGDEGTSALDTTRPPGE